MSWIRYRFYTDQNDYRPVKWPAVGPYWCTGYSASNAVVVAYLPVGVDLLEFWPDAANVDEEPRHELTFTDRFPKPSWWRASCDCAAGTCQSKDGCRMAEDSRTRNPNVM